LVPGRPPHPARPGWRKRRLRPTLSPKGGRVVNLNRCRPRSPRRRGPAISSRFWPCLRAVIAQRRGCAIAYPARLPANIVTPKQLQADTKKARTEPRLLSDRCESKVEHCRKVSGDGAGKATAETCQCPSPAARSPSYFGFWISGFGLKREHLHTVINPKSIRGGQCLYLEFRQAAP